MSWFLNFFSILILVAGSWQLSIKEFSVPKAVQIGQDAELRCHYELGTEDDESSVVVKWFWTMDEPDGSGSLSENFILFYTRISGRPGFINQRRSFTMIEKKEYDDVVLKNMHAMSTGTYVCLVSTFTSEVQKTGKLTVYSKGTGPVLNISDIKDEGTGESRKTNSWNITCHAADVAPRPILRVKLNGQDIIMNTTVEGHDYRGLYKIYGNTIVNSGDVDKGEYEVQCEISLISFVDSSFEHPPYVTIKTSRDITTRIV